MNWTNKSLSFLDLDSVETKVLESLAQAKTHQEVATEIKIPRTTAAFKTNNLLKKGLVLSIKNGKRFRYISLTESQLSDKLQNIIGEIRATASDRKGAQIRLSKESEFIIHVGTKEIIPAYERIASMSQDERIKAIQGIKSWKALLEKISPAQLIRFNQAVIENNLIIDGIVQKSSYKVYGEMIRKDPKAQKETAESLIGRMADYVFVPDNFFDVSSEIWLFKSTAFIINWEQEVAVEIINADIMSFLRNMFEFVKIAGTKIDHNEAMRQLLGNTVIN